MNMILQNTDFTAAGIFGDLFTDGDKHFCVTLQHAFDSGNGDGTFLPKIPPGSYQCVRGTHSLDGIHTFETFEITGVKGHTGLLFHPGNYNKDSNGCCLLGDERHGDMIMNSKITFQKFLTLQKDVDTFTLTVIGG